MPKSIAAMGGQYLDHHIFRIARTQREAGVEFFGWENRIKPLRPLFYDIAVAGALLTAAAASFAGYFFLS
jgi:hypothetical protein